MPVEEFLKCTGPKKHKLFNKILETLSKFTKRINIHNFLLSELKQSKKCLSNFNLTRSKSHDDLDFMRPIDDFGNRKFISQDHSGLNSNKWEVLSQITHTPQSGLKIGFVDQSFSDNKLSRHKSMNDLVFQNNRNKSTKHVEKLNCLLDFVMSQMLNSPYKDSDKLSKSIQDVIIESGVQIILQSINELNESFYQKNMAGNPNYLRVIYSPETSSSDSDTLMKPNWLSIDYEPDIYNNSFPTITKENYHNIKKISKNSNIVCNPNSHTDKINKNRLNMKNIMSPSFRESCAFKYNSKLKSTCRKSQKTQNQLKDSKIGSNLDKKVNGEYSCYMTAKKASNSQLTSKSKSNSNVSIYNTKCSLENNHAVNLSPILEHKSIEKLQNNNKTVLSKSTIDGPLPNNGFLISNNNKLKKGNQTNPNKKLVKNENISSDKISKKDNSSNVKIISKPSTILRFSTENLQITKASSVDCLSGDKEKSLGNKANVKVLNIKFDDSIKKSLEKKLNITPIKFVFAGENYCIKTQLNKPHKIIENISNVRKLKSVVSNFKYFNDDIKNLKTNLQIAEAVSLKSKTTFGINTGYISNGKQKLQISNYNSNSNTKNQSDNLMKIEKSNEVSDWSNYIQKLELENSIYSKKIRCHSPKSPELINVTTISMVNNNNDRVDLEISETEQPNTDSSCTFHAVRAKYFKEYLPLNSDSEFIGNGNFLGITNENLLSNTNEFSKIYDIDPNPEEIKNIYDKVRSRSNVKQISIGQTYSCDENNDLLLCNTSSFINSQSFVTKYNTSTEDEEEMQNQCNLSDSTYDRNQTNPIDNFNETPISLNIKPQIKETVNMKLKRNFSIIQTSLVDILPVLDNNLSSFISETDNNSETQTPSINVVYCRNPIEKRSIKRYQKNIPENLLKHTFASQQKVRLKHE